MSPRGAVTVLGVFTARTPSPTLSLYPAGFVPFPWATAVTTRDRTMTFVEPQRVQVCDRCTGLDPAAMAPPPRHSLCTSSLRGWRAVSLLRCPFE